jgi:hypothetical protein
MKLNLYNSNGAGNNQGRPNELYGRWTRFANRTLVYENGLWEQVNLILTENDANPLPDQQIHLNKTIGSRPHYRTFFDSDEGQEIRDMIFDSFLDEIRRYGYVYDYATSSVIPSYT